MKKYLKTLLVALPTSLCATAASAGEVYGTAGFLGYGLGYAQPLGPNLGVRADFATAGSRSERRTEEGIDYDAKLKLDRTNLLLDWFVMAGTFRISTGLTLANTKLVLDGSGAGGTLTVGGTTYTTTSADGFTATIKYPSTMPYLGIGWGHGMQSDKGWRFALDIGAAIGKPKVSVVTRGQLTQAAAQGDVDRETQELRDGVGAVKVLPQVMFSAGYSF
jgi:hypothetical protein